MRISKKQQRSSSSGGGGARASAPAIDFLSFSRAQIAHITYLEELLRLDYVASRYSLSHSLPRMLVIACFRAGPLLLRLRLTHGV